MHLPTISLALLSALAVNAEFYIVGTSGEFADGYYGFPAVINDVNNPPHLTHPPFLLTPP